MAQLIATFPNDVQFVYRHFPLPSHDKAPLATIAAEAAGRQGQFWQMHDLLFERFGEWTSLSLDDFRTFLLAAAAELDLDATRFAADLDDPALASFAQQAADDAIALGLPGTPTIAINGQYYDGPADYFNLSTIISLLLLKDRQYTDCPPLVIDPLKQYIATIETEKGTVVVELFAEQAPLAVNSFVFLANDGWFNGVTFHRVLPGFVAQAGDPSGTGYGGPGYAFQNEVSEDLTFDGPGVLAMANAGPDSNGSQFFITLAERAELYGGYTIFGRVLEGMEVVGSLTARDPSADPTLPPGDKIITITIEER